MSLVSLSDDAQSFSDERGSLNILFESHGISLKRSHSIKNVFRGMHWQGFPYHQIKLIRVIEGEIIDFIVDMTNFKQGIHSTTLHPSKGWQMVPANYAHGFYTITNCVFEYFCIGDYKEEAEISFSILDFLEKEHGVINPMMSFKDSNNMSFNEVTSKSWK